MTTAKLPAALAILGAGAGVGLLVNLLGDLPLRWILYPTLALFAALGFLLWRDKRTLLTAGFLLSLQVDVYIRLFYGRGGGSEGLVFPLVFFAGIALLGYLGWTRPQLVRQWKPGGSLLVPIVALLAATALSLLVTSERFVGLSHFVSALHLYLLYWLAYNLTQSSEALHRHLTILLTMLVTQSAIYFVQSALGITFNLAGHVIPEGEIPRPGGTVSANPAGFASFITPLVLIAYAHLSATRKGMRGGYALLLFVLGAGAMALTFTRAAWSGLAIGLTALVILSARRRLLRWRSVAIGAALLAAAGLTLAPMMSARLSSDYSQVSPDGGQSGLSERIGLMRIAVNVIKSHPLTGVGPGAYGHTFKAYVPSGMRQWLFTVHNQFLLVTAELGIPGGIAFIALLLGALRSTLRVSRAQEPRVALFGVGMFGALVSLIWQMSWVPWSGFSYNAMLWLLLGMIDGARRMLGPSPSPSPERGRTGTTAAPGQPRPSNGPGPVATAPGKREDWWAR